MLVKLRCILCDFETNDEDRMLAHLAAEHKINCTSTNGTPIHDYWLVIELDKYGKPIINADG